MMFHNHLFPIINNQNALPKESTPDSLLLGMFLFAHLFFLLHMTLKKVTFFVSRNEPNFSSSY